MTPSIIYIRNCYSVISIGLGYLSHERVLSKMAQEIFSKNVHKQEDFSINTVKERFNQNPAIFEELFAISIIANVIWIAYIFATDPFIPQPPFMLPRDRDIPNEIMMKGMISCYINLFLPLCSHILGWVFHDLIESPEKNIYRKVMKLENSET